MQEEIPQFEQNNVCELVLQPTYTNVIETKWIFKNKSIEHDNIVRNNAHGYNQVEGMNFEETFAPVTRLLLFVVCQIGFKLYQMDVKSVFLNGILNEKAYFEQPK